MRLLVCVFLLIPVLLVGQTKDPYHPVAESVTLSMQSSKLVKLAWQPPDTVYNTVFYENFESGTIPESWTLYDIDGDTNMWEMHPADWSAAHDGMYSVASYSWFNGDSLMPDNWLVTPAITLPENAQLRYFIAAISQNFSEEHYQVRLSTTGNAVDDFTDTIIDETLPEGSDEWHKRSIDLNDWAGQEVFIAFVHNQISGMFALKLDDISVNQTEAVKNPQIVAYNIYKKYENQTAQYVGEVSNHDFSFIDTLSQGGDYSYGVSVEYGDGAVSNQVFSNWITYTNWLPPVQDFTANTNGGLVSLNWSNSSPQNKVVLQEGFEDFTNLVNWQIYDYDNDGSTWEQHTATTAYEGEQSIASYSWLNGQTLYPDNWLISKRVPLLYADSVSLQWAVSSINKDYVDEYYQLRISGTEADTGNFAIAFEETLSQNDTSWSTRSFALNNYAGDSIYLAFVHQQISDVFGLKIDDIKLQTINPRLGFKLYRLSPNSQNMELIDSLDYETFSYEETLTDTGQYQYYISAIYKNGGESLVTASDVIEYNALPDIQRASVSVYPNPTIGGTFYIKSNEPIFRVAAYNLKGQKVLSYPVSGRQNVAMEPDLKTGQYLITIELESGVVRKKIVLE